MSVIVGLVAGLAIVVASAPPRRARPFLGGGSGAPRPTAAPAAALGRAVQRRVPFDLDLSPAALGAAVVATFVLVAVVPVLAPLVPAAVVARAGRRRRARARHRAERIRRGLPEILDLLALGVSAGLTVRDALARSVDGVPEPFAGPFVDVVRRTRAGAPFIDALAGLTTTLGDEVRPLVTVVAAAERDGAALGPALERAADEARRRRRVAAEEAVRRVPVAMLFPLVTCVLPAFALLTVVPVLIGTLSGIELPGTTP